MKIRLELWSEGNWAWWLGRDGDSEEYYAWVEPKRPFPDDRWESAMAWLTQFVDKL